MYIQQADLFEGMESDFVMKFMQISEKETHKKGHFLFYKGDPAAHFYILIKGRVKLSIGKTEEVHYIVDHAGEAFGWSSLIDRDVYSASGECLEETILQKFDKNKMHAIIENDPVNGLIFFKRFAGTIGTRLLWSYNMLTASSQAWIYPSLGTEQIQESEAVG
jgi:CRP/FNR family transcriptional regulator, cyclic AMP receptor protein